MNRVPGGGGVFVFCEAATQKDKQADGNGFAVGTGSDLSGLGIGVTHDLADGTNTAHGNDDSAECNPTPLC